MRTQIFKWLYRFGTARVLRRAKQDQLTILSLHRVTEDRDYYFQPIRPATFDALLRHLARHYTIVPFADVSSLKKGMKKPPLILSFDDGYYDFVQFTMPILQKHKLGANVNIVNECANSNMQIWTQRLNWLFIAAWDGGLVNMRIELNGQPFTVADFNGDWHRFYLKVFTTLLTYPREPRLALIRSLEEELGQSANYRMMNWDEVRQCAEAGIEVGCHTYTHDVISTITDAELLHKEITLSKLEMEAQLRRPVTLVSLPNGQGNEAAEAEVRRAGYEYMLYVDNRTNPLPITGAEMKVMYRIGLLDECLEETALRVELFHNKFSKP
ncbi:MAG: hypothetical protein EOO08_07020 [Chitinophagaceae bacterium]|nr:MAG: hypothetical protein EOO08_07020 [Chitinophagaceae bacterium]